MELLLGNCLDKLKELDDNSVDSIVTDPPYGLSAPKNSGKSSKGGFMGKKWDYDVPSQEIWEECLRVLKPGGHLLSFGGSRTYHRMAVRIEDAGFEIRDQISWLYGSGFPKSMNISKQIDKVAGEEREVVGKRRHPTLKDKSKLSESNTASYGGTEWSREWDITAPSTDEAKQWEGWGTALKPAHEPIVMARKPLSEKTVVDNVLKWGTGGINIDESRVELQEFGEDKRLGGKGDWSSKGMAKNVYGEYAGDRVSSSPKGRFPTNIILDEEAGKQLDEQTGVLKSGMMKAGTKRKMSEGDVNTYGYYDSDTTYNSTHGDSGGASRFFYCPKTSKTDRNEGLDGNIIYELNDDTNEDIIKQIKSVLKLK